MPSETWLEFVRWPYEDEGWHVSIRAGDAAYRVEQEFYTYASDLTDLAERFQTFPAHSSEIVIQAGSKEPNWAGWVVLRVFMLDTAGHAAITIDVGSNGDDLRSRAARFTIACDVGSVNRLGTSLKQWVDEPWQPLRERLFAS